MTKEVKYINWIDLVVFLTDISQLDIKRIKEWDSLFHRVTVSCSTKRPEYLPSSVEWVTHNVRDSRSAIWNDLIDKAEKNWVLFVQDDEIIRFNEFPAEHELSKKRWAPALIIHTNENKLHQHYQMRLVQKDNKRIFEGKNLPDCTRYIVENDISLSPTPIMLQRKESPVLNVDPADELGMRTYSPQVYLVQGEHYFKEKKYVHAAAQFRQILKIERLLPYDRLGAVNGLASCMTEQYKWPQALALVEKSIEAEPLQSVPYLIRFKIFQLQKQWNEAYKALQKYYELLELYSRANFDVKISEEETLLNLADLALKAGSRKEASNYLNELFVVKNGKIDEGLVQKLFLLSVELSDYEKSVFFYNKIIGNAIGKAPLSEQDNVRLNEYMSLFMQNEWFEFVYQQYLELHNEYPDNDEYKRRLIVASLKTERVEQAQKLVAKVA